MDGYPKVGFSDSISSFFPISLLFCPQWYIFCIVLKSDKTFCICILKIRSRSRNSLESTSYCIHACDQINYIDSVDFIFVVVVYVDVFDVAVEVDVDWIHVYDKTIKHRLTYCLFPKIRSLNRQLNDQIDLNRHLCVKRISEKIACSSK